MSNYGLEELKDVLLQQQDIYPKMQLVDFVKLIYQNEFGGGHMIRNEAAAWQRLLTEWTAQKNQASSTHMFDHIGNGICRINLGPIQARGITAETVNRFFVLSANSVQGTRESFAAKLQAFEQWCADGLFAYTPKELNAYLSAYRAQGYPPVSHSEVYRRAYAPAYRVIKTGFQFYFPLFCQIDQLRQRARTINIAIDGPSGSGKTSLADLLGQVYDCNIIHMDDFFLPSQLRTSARLAEAGGNIYYERFSEEVMTGLCAGQDFSYGVYDCSQDAIARQVHVGKKQLNIIEGVYSLHPQFIDLYALKVFLQVDAQTQSQRILQRNGAAMHRRFLNEWIPLENRYFAEHSIADKADLVFYQ